MTKPFIARTTLSISALMLGVLSVPAPSAASLNVIIPPDLPSIADQQGLVQKDLVLAIGQSLTDKVLLRLREAEDQCQKLPFEYRVDCLSKGYRAASNEMRRAPDYNGARQAIDQAAKKLDQLVKANQDKAAPIIRAGNLRRIRAVKKATVPQVLKQAQAVVTEAETKLIRSAGSSKKKLLHYTQIAEAVGSTKKLLRST